MSRFAFNPPRYHATHERNVEGIKKEGLKPNPNDPGKALMFTTNSGHARKIANAMYGTAGRIVKFTLPGGHTPTNLRGDMEGMPNLTSQQTTKTIPPEYIKNVYIPKSDREKGWRT